MNKPLLVDDYDLPLKKKHIVIAKPNVERQKFVDLLKSHGVDIEVDYNGLSRHYLISCDDEKFDNLSKDENVLLIESADRMVYHTSSELVEVDATGYGGNWGLTRICRREDWNDSTWYPNTGNYTYFRDGDGVDVYVVDTGCRITHSEFGGRASIIFDYYLKSDNPSYGLDQQGHGTHVSSTIAGAKYGVAKKAKILMSRVFETGGATLDAIVAGIDACLVHHKNSCGHIKCCLGYLAEDESVIVPLSGLYTRRCDWCYRGCDDLCRCIS